jgi:hypothetical protein
MLSFDGKGPTLFAAPDAMGRQSAPQIDKRGEGCRKLSSGIGNGAAKEATTIKATIIRNMTPGNSKGLSVK